VRLKKVTKSMWLAQCLAWNKSSVNVTVLLCPEQGFMICAPRFMNVRVQTPVPQKPYIHKRFMNVSEQTANDSNVQTVGRSCRMVQPKSHHVGAGGCGSTGRALA
jgi:hypothetical protein